jgi:hypothetical protein
MKMLILSVILYLFYSTLVFTLLIRISSLIAAVALLGMPILIILIAPDMSISFLAYQHAVLGDGMIPINNLHIMLFIWSSLLAIIMYTEFITWYLGRGAGGAPGDAGGAGDAGAESDATEDSSMGGGMDADMFGGMGDEIGDDLMGGDDAFGDLMGGDDMWGGGDDEMPPPF